MKVSFNLFVDQIQDLERLIPRHMQSKLLRDFIRDFSVPYKSLEDRSKKIKMLVLDDRSLKKLDELVQQARDKNIPCNRSAMLRFIIQQLIVELKVKKVAVTNQKMHSSFYFEKGTVALFNDLIPFRERNATIEFFVLTEYIPQYISKEKPIEPETMRVSMDMAAFARLDHIADALHVTRADLMRDVAAQLIEKLGNNQYVRLMAKKKLDRAIQTVQDMYGESVIQEEFEKYMVRRKKHE